MSAFETLRSNVQGQLLEPGDDGYDAGRQPWNLLIDQHPVLVVMAESTSDVQAAIRTARERGLPLSVLSTGHGAVRPCDDGVVLNVSRMAEVRVEAGRHVARISAGARWGPVVEAAAPHGLAGLSGTAVTVGAVGYTLGGGIGLLVRRFGLAADAVVAAKVVTADGKLVRASTDDHPDLFWALKGGGGNFGVVTALDIGLFDVPQVYNGALAYPGERAAEVLATWAEWTAQVPDEVTSAATVVFVPPVPAVPEPIRGRLVVNVRATVVGTSSAAIDQLRGMLGEPLMDTFGPTSYLQAALSGSEPADPMPSAGQTVLLDDLSTTVADAAVAIAEPEMSVVVDIRHLGGAVAREPERPSAVSHPEARYLVAAHAAPRTPEEHAAVQAHLDKSIGAFEPRGRSPAFLTFLPTHTTPEAVRGAFSADTYERLQQVKRTYDPGNLFRHTHTIPPAS